VVNPSEVATRKDKERGTLANILLNMLFLDTLSPIEKLAEE